MQLSDKSVLCRQRRCISQPSMEFLSQSQPPLCARGQGDTGHFIRLEWRSCSPLKHNPDLSGNQMSLTLTLVAHPAQQHPASLPWATEDAKETPWGCVLKVRQCFSSSASLEFQAARTHRRAQCVSVCRDPAGHTGPLPGPMLQQQAGEGLPCCTFCGAQQGGQGGGLGTGCTLSSS